MIKLEDKNTIFWDFDGVIMDSMNIRNKGFEFVFKDFPPAQIQSLMDYHHKNGGLSRYVKIRYFFEEIRNESISRKGVLNYAQKFSEIMKKHLTNTELLISDSCNFISNNWKKYNMHIVSGSDQEELRFLCNKLNLEQYFISINGSPTPKKELVAKILKRYSYDTTESVLIGDSINDYDAAIENNIDFLGYNNNSLAQLGKGYIENFTND